MHPFRSLYTPSFLDIVGRVSVKLAGATATVLNIFEANAYPRIEHFPDLSRHLQKFEKKKL